MLYLFDCFKDRKLYMYILTYIHTALMYVHMYVHRIIINIRCIYIYKYHLHKHIVRENEFSLVVGASPHRLACCPS